MREPYRQCDACGKRALSIANRCPGCGRELPAIPVPKGSGGLELGRFLTPQVGAAVAVVVVLVSANVALTGQPTAERATVRSSVASTAPGDAARVAELPAGRPGDENAKLASSMAKTDPVETARVAELPAERGGELRVAQSWTEVRQSRNVRAPVEAVLTPGDTVRTDSLAGGWYRVALEGEVLGYAHRSTLAVLGAGVESHSGR